jgi:hypothetical protein
MRRIDFLLFRRPRTRALALGCALSVGVLALAAPSLAQDVAYRLRANREEGLRNIRTSGEGGLRLLSFVAAREPVRLVDQPVLKVRFFLAQPRQVFITAVELRRHGTSHYLMRPVQTRWPGGWQQFAPWPTADVLAHAKIEPAQLGVLARLDEDLDDGSGSIVPVIVYAGQPPARASRYVAHFLPRNTLSRVNYSVENVRTGARVIDNSLCEDRPGKAAPCRPGNVPFELELDLAAHLAGDYRLVIDTREHGRASGPSQQYFFRHEPAR